MGESGDGGLKLVVDRKRRPARRYGGAPLECPQCQSRETVETRIGRTVRSGKVSRGQTRIRCYHCGTVLWG